MTTFDIDGETNALFQLLISGSKALQFNHKQWFDQHGNECLLYSKSVLQGDYSSSLSVAIASWILRMITDKSIRIAHDTTSTICDLAVSALGRIVAILDTQDSSSSSLHDNFLACVALLQTINSILHNAHCAS